MKKESGFTLVELMVVIVILGVLAAVAIPKMSMSMNKAKASEVQSVIRMIASSQDAYFMETNTYIACPWADANSDKVNDNLKEQLSIESPSHYWHYEVRQDGALPLNESFQAVAVTEQPFGDLAVGDAAWMNAASQKYITPGSALEDYIMPWR